MVDSIQVFICKKDAVFKVNFNTFFFIKKNRKYQCLNFKGPLGDQKIQISFRVIKTVNQKKFLLRYRAFSKLINTFGVLLFGICCGYFNRFKIEGYNYRVKSSFSNAYILLFVGHRYSILLKFPTSIKIFPRKRAFTVFGTNFIEVNYVLDYIRHLRDLFPYKKRGFVLTKENISLKRGKKEKFK